MRKMFLRFIPKLEAEVFQVHLTYKGKKGNVPLNPSSQTTANEEEQ
ncbi:hypothetical protein NIES4103_32860 [Nostoc sp. NIES-4103]|nr:hypothetical protein NIES4103_32860 [Nostoc sp. NIES-4103]